MALVLLSNTYLLDGDTRWHLMNRGKCGRVGKVLIANRTSLVLRETGEDGQCGLGTTDDSLSMQKISAPVHFTFLSAGTTQTLFLTGPTPFLVLLRDVTLQRRGVFGRVGSKRSGTPDPMLGN